jgi:hypothetical protein
MTKEDVKIIFNNVADLALFSDLFTERLEDALGSVLEGGAGQDRVGALFLEMVRVSGMPTDACPNLPHVWSRSLYWNRCTKSTSHDIQPPSST